MISSRANPKIKQARALRQRKERDASGLFLVEGIHHVAEAIEAGAAVEYLCYAPDLLTSEFARELIARELARGLACLAVSSEVFESIAEKENPIGILAVARKSNLELSNLRPETFNWGVALVSPQDPGNIGSILRSIDGAGASGLILLDGGADPYHPSAVRASMGALFWKPVASAAFAEFAGWAKKYGYRLVGASAQAAVDYREANYSRPLILLLGSEQKGLSPEQIAICDQTVRLPMLGRVSSLNLSAAAGVLLYSSLPPSTTPTPPPAARRS